jgi:sodium/bile acid cotransporter 7
MGVPLINVLYQKGDPGTIGILSTPLLLYHVEQLILGNIEVEILKKWVARGQRQEADKKNMAEGNNSSDQQQNRDEENVFVSGVARIDDTAAHHYHQQKL